ncbi:phosphocholine cytidylyltransferase family protein [Campylobacter sp. MIT 21-1685]|uniref:phosphocholine cytidylyltransferase family protein n=1 Tax=unclassified Campylobacter TaxID=2593542 RepID=UPI00224A8F06|nr:MULTISPECIES: phosphocholine cytidylyltransferase family protein [unclassified Campylobacter]MCX2682336.1 phosphocholine cytidylyltransferase family protein [Campylobacter sp. MIT 21-1684]MCX2750616.1 phosphocholine cytidylyltransferase family protein [Campylobacter sp. MIT 21-1682]MCX2806836.1 phosphocholine cytidylyltransferase family protein [Campylobacter sp. MIT 21-1685]
MKALILAAGFGSRLMPLTKNNPKCMVEYQGKKIIEYEIEALNNAGIEEIAIVGGYCFELLEQFVRTRYNIKKIFYNKDYADTNMVCTLFCAKDFLYECIEDKEDCIISYADIIYFKESVEKLAKKKAPLAIVIDKEWKKLWEKRFKNPLNDLESLKLDSEGKIKELGKKVYCYDEIQGQYIGLFKISYDLLPKLIELYESLDKNTLYDGKDFKNMYMTSFLQILIQKFGNASAIEIYGKWCEIDFKSDLSIII